MLSWQTLRTAYEQEQRNQVIDWLFSFSWIFWSHKYYPMKEHYLCPSLSVSLSQTHTCTHTQTLSISVCQTNTHTHTLSISQTQTCTHSLSLKHAHTHIQTHTLSLSLNFPFWFWIWFFDYHFSVYITPFLTLKPHFIWLECLVPHRKQVRGNRLRTLYPLTAVRTTFPAHSTMLLRMLC